LRNTALAGRGLSANVSELSSTSGTPPLKYHHSVDVFNIYLWYSCIILVLDMIEGYKCEFESCGKGGMAGEDGWIEGWLGVNQGRCTLSQDSESMVRHMHNVYRG
jgi:hypothetical protein